MENKEIVVTGGCGFIGSHIVEELLENNKVTIIDNLSSGKMENLKNPNHENLTLIEEDLLDCDLDEILKELNLNIDLVINLNVLCLSMFNLSSQQKQILIGFITKTLPLYKGNGHMQTPSTRAGFYLFLFYCVY